MYRKLFLILTLIFVISGISFALSPSTHTASISNSNGTNYTTIGIGDGKTYYCTGQVSGHCTGTYQEQLLVSVHGYMFIHNYNSKDVAPRYFESSIEYSSGTFSTDIDGNLAGGNFTFNPNSNYMIAVESGGGYWDATYTFIIGAALPVGD